MINCTLPCSDSHCIFLFVNPLHTLLLSPSDKLRVQVVIFFDPLCFKLFNCYHDYRILLSPICHSYKFTKILLNSCFFLIVYTVYVLIYWLAQLSDLTIGCGTLSGLVDT